MIRQKTITAVISESCSNIVTVKTTDVKGLSVTKEMPYATFVEFLCDTNQRPACFGERLGIPEGCYDVTYDSPGNFSGIIIVPSEPFIVSYMENKYVVPFPSLAFYIKVSHGKVVKTLCRALKSGEKKITDKTKLYYYPFGNVYIDGKICWGGNSLPDIEKPSDLSLIPRLFLSAPTNSDLWTSGANINLGKLEPVLSKVYEALNGKKQFPNAMLKECKQNVGQLFQL